MTFGLYSLKQICMFYCKGYSCYKLISTNSSGMSLNLFFQWCSEIMLLLLSIMMGENVHILMWVTGLCLKNSIVL